jgi:predicted nuclease of predicted toxin-antitoxin system
LKFLLDANVGSTIAQALLDAGHDVVRAALAFPHASDVSILATAVSEGRILITGDRDFGSLVFQHDARPPPAIIYIRFEPDEVADVVPRLMPLLDDPELKGHLTVVGHENTRRRPFPAKS